MKIIVVYYSHSENNEKLAIYLKDKLKCDIHKIIEKKRRKTFSILLDFIFKGSTELATSDIALEEFDIIVFVSPIWGSKVATPLRTFIEDEKARIKRYSFISLCNSEVGQNEKLTNELTHICDKAPIVCTELSINQLLPEEKKNKIKYTFNFRISDNDLMYLNDEIESFISVLKDCGELLHPTT